MRPNQKLSVLLTPEEDARFCAYCTAKGFKKSTLIARLIRDHLDDEGFGLDRIDDAAAATERRKNKNSQEASMDSDN